MPVTFGFPLFSLPKNTSTHTTGASVGKGETEGSSAWVNEQSSIIGASSVTIRTEGHTQIDGAVIANQDAAGNDLGNLSLDTGTLGFSDIKDYDKEDSYYLNVGFNAGDNTGTNQTESGTTYTAGGSLSSHDKEQINRATIGDGTITVRKKWGQVLPLAPIFRKKWGQVLPLAPIFEA